MNFNTLTRTGTALAAGAALFAAVSTGAYAAPTTFNVSTTITASCVVTDDGPTNLTPTYDPTTDTGTGNATSLNTACTGVTPSVVFTDSDGSNTNYFQMSSGSSNLWYQISNNPGCNGGPGDNPILENDAITLGTGTASYDICAAVITGGVNTAVPAGSYTDTVTYTITP